MNLSRLMVLATLAQHGPQHGHQIRRLAEVTNVGVWGGVSTGALYRELRSMEGEGLVIAIRTEQVGRRPERTVYEITADGRIELVIQRDQAMSSTQKGPDALGVALLFGGVSDVEETISVLHLRNRHIEAALEQVATERARLVERGLMDPIAASVMRRGEVHLEAEVRWHEEFAEVLKAIADKPPKERNADH